MAAPYRTAPAPVTHGRNDYPLTVRRWRSNGEQIMRPQGSLEPNAHVSHLAQLRKAQIDHLAKSGAEDVRDLLSKTEHFVFTGIPVRDHPDICASAEAMKEAGVWRLPFPVCTFEFDAELTHNGERAFPRRASRMILICTESTGEPTICYSFIRATKHAWVNQPLDPALGINVQVEHDGVRYGDVMEIAATCLVLLATRGIRRERWTGDRPVLKNRSEPRDAYTKVLVREASEEQGHSDAQGDSTDRCRVRLHLRRGHIRHQPVGPRSAGKTHMIWIAPMLVGYAEEGTIEHSHYERRPTPA